MSKKQKKEKLLDAVGILCGLIVLGFIIGNIIAAHTATTIGDADVPDDAQTLTGSAIGRNGPIDVEVVATPDRIYQIKVTNHTETEGIGSVAVEELPVTIYENQSLAVDSVSGATITSDGIKNAVIDALQSGGIDPAASRTRSQPRLRWKRTMWNWNVTSWSSVPAVPVLPHRSLPHSRDRTSSCWRRCPSSAATASVPRAA